MVLWKPFTNQKNTTTNYCVLVDVYWSSVGIFLLIEFIYWCSVMIFEIWNSLHFDRTEIDLKNRLNWKQFLTGEYKNKKKAKLNFWVSTKQITLYREYSIAIINKWEYNRLVSNHSSRGKRKQRKVYDIENLTYDNPRDS